ncbi:DUF4340 domain-containing protein [Chryseosolibacter indicus]|uniref:DUF4340 domain-containing protein n=1 Tax=Chryseosolibacter indicus TaxID=2782351 RepID=A0ABS5VW76_9BACT|nr:DUF4340 domain-containing protein [Chryseosolibacter indicus]MBT1705669.1 DUF4340 domain-containing protein [Chryseosolibacter indicus]
MQEQRNKRLFISLVVLAVITASVFYLTQQEATSFVDNNIFKVSDTEQIDRVVLDSKNGRVELSYVNSRWIVNKQYPADGNMIKVLFATLQQVNVKRPVSAKQADSISRKIRGEGVHVLLYEGETQRKSFYAGGNNVKTQAFFTTEVGNEAYLVNIPGYRVYVSGIFELNSDGYRDKYVFNFNWQNFKSLEADFPANPADNFKVEFERNFFTIKGETKVDTAKLNTFLDNVSLLTVDEYRSNNTIADSLAGLKPVMTLTIEDIATRKYLLKLYSPERKGQIMGLINENPGLFNKKKISAILKPKSFFRKK